LVYLIFLIFEENEAIENYGFICETILIKEGLYRSLG